MFWALSGQLFCLFEVDLLVWSRDGEMVSERSSTLHKEAQQIPTQGLPLPHSVMPEGFLKVGLWSSGCWVWGGQSAGRGLETADTVWRGGVVRASGPPTQLPPT